MTHGAHALTPARIPFTGWKDVAFRVKNQVAKDRVGLLAAGVAFYGLLALFPAITAVIAISGLLIEPGRIVVQLNSFSGLMPEEVITIITKQATAVAGSHQGGLGFTAILALQLRIFSDVTFPSDCLMCSAPNRPCNDFGGMDLTLRHFMGDAANFLH